MPTTTENLPANVFASAESQVRIADESFLSTYANNVTMTVSQWDVSVLFGEIAGRNEEGKAVILQKVKINMSKELAKVFNILLETHIKGYEDQFGEIKIPDMTQLSDDKVNAQLAKATKGNVVKSGPKPKSLKPKT